MVEATLESTFSHETAGTAATDDNDNNSNENDNTKEEVMKKHSRVALFQDAITVSIPIDVTVDLGVAFRRTRDKRIAGLYNAFPSLKPKDETEGEEDKDEDDDEEEGEEDAAESSDGAAKKKKKNDSKKKAPSKASDNVPQPREFASVLDYLEAKYVRGVMIHNEQPAAKKKKGDSDDSKSKQEEDEEDDDEGQGSVYSETSFLDDRDLQRDVAEQVLAQTTTTKLELEGDDDFFVNVGDLDVEENELTQHTYDPLEDSPTKKSKTKTNTKKRKKPATTSTKTGSPAKKKKIPSKATADKDDKSKGEKKKKAKPAPKATTKGKVKTVDNSSDSSEAVVAAVAASNTKKPVPKKNKEEIKKLKQKAKKYKNIMEKRFEKVKKMIKTLDAESLPRSRPSTSKVTITCPANKKEGDEVTFTNPHNPGQRLKVTVPKGTPAGGTFKVTVPVPKNADEAKDGVDHNKFPREFQDELDIYAKEYDDYCRHEGEFRHANDGDKSTFAIHLEKRKKFDKMVELFPKNLMTPIDVAYMKKLVRRARQNKSKRTKTAANRRQSGDTAPQTESGEEDNDDTNAADSDEEASAAPEEPKSAPTHSTLEIPQRGVVFPEVQYDRQVFLFQVQKEEEDKETPKKS